MDFWDLFINEEQINNSAAIEYLEDRIPNFYRDNGTPEALVYADFVYLNDFDKEDFLSALILLSNIDKLRTDELDADMMLLFYKFYHNILGDFNTAGYSLSKAAHCRLAMFKTDKYLLNNFNRSLEIYSNFKNQTPELIQKEKQDLITGKLIIVVKNKMYIYYLKERKEEDGL